MEQPRFASLESRVDQAVTRHLSNVRAMYTPADAGQGGAAGREVLGIFSEEAEYPNESAVATAVPYLDLLRSDVPELTSGDVFLINTMRYRVADIAPGGGGRVVVRMHKVD